MTAPGGVVMRTVLDTGQGRDGFFRRFVKVPDGARFEGAAGPGGELWFVTAGAGRLEPAAGPALPLDRDTGVWLPPGARYRLDPDGPDAITLDSVWLPALASQRAASADDDAGPRVSQLRDCAVQMTGDRRFRVLLGPGNGCSAATQFVGEIPPGRAPHHFHSYDEVVLILEGEGVLHAGSGDHPLAPGSCVHLPPGEPHCLENTGQATLRVLGVFHPGGSPASKQAPAPA